MGKLSVLLFLVVLAAVAVSADHHKKPKPTRGPRPTGRPTKKPESAESREISSEESTESSEHISEESTESPEHLSEESTESPEHFSGESAEVRYYHRPRPPRGPRPTGRPTEKPGSAESREISSEESTESPEHFSGESTESPEHFSGESVEVRHHHRPRPRPTAFPTRKPHSAESGGRSARSRELESTYPEAE